MSLTEEMKKAYMEACRAREAAYAPYSQFKVGACFKYPGKNDYFSGFNIEKLQLSRQYVCRTSSLIWYVRKITYPPPSGIFSNCH